MSSIEYKKDYYKRNRQKLLKRASEYRKANQDKIKELKIKYRNENREKIRIYNRNYRKENPEKSIKYQQKYYRNNKKEQLARTKLRKATQLKRTPSWSEKQQIQTFYLNCPQNMTVDHYYPLQGEFVSGLHVLANLQYLTKSENCSKNNKTPGIDYPEED